MKDKLVSIKRNSSESDEEEGSIESKEEAESDDVIGKEDSNSDEVNNSETDQFDFEV